MIPNERRYLATLPTTLPSTPLPLSPRFDSTQWSLVIAAAHRSLPEGLEALAKLCEKSWYPLYAHVRQTESDVHRAKDLTQGFFAKVLEKNYIAEADPARGKFRTFLLASLTHFIANEWDKSKAIKRGGDRSHFSLELDVGQRRFLHEPTDNQTAEKQLATADVCRLFRCFQYHFLTANRTHEFERLASACQARISCTTLHGWPSISVCC